ncbi:type VI secretion system Vgr family protein [Flavobacterium ginsengiterrae]|uniref:Gp5/Type VI secretion system Vgr protein OB-fold domain-containing protein n=1 Tax=Flavobacterium ginsengiterrae TaxID=871695 RepID=A0ABP7H6M8_9FLAO
MTRFSEQVKITIDDFTKTVIYYDLQITQKMMDHHHFSFVWQHTAETIINPVNQAAAIRRYQGREVIFTFKSLTGIQLMAKGIITNLNSDATHGDPALRVEGISHTILLDDLKKARTFLDNSLQEIALQIFADETAGEFYQRQAIVPTYTKIFDYKAQYNETSFNFLKRLSARYGQWFYFDGMRMQFGQLKNSKVKLINESSLHKFGIQTHLASHKISFGAYDPDNAKQIVNSQSKTNQGSADSFSKVVLDRQASVAQPQLYVAAYTNQVKNASEIEEMVKLQTAGRDANSVFYTGVSYLPIGVGQIFTIQNQTVEHELVAVEVIHRSELHGNYNCEFKAIPADVSAPYYTNVEVFAKADCQPAIVTDNNDPEALGRVKVSFYWGAGSTKTEWMRVIQHFAGHNRGAYWIPEIGDEVLVSFENGNVDFPYVSGSHYNGQAKPEFFDSKNNTKGWKLRFGQLLKFIEKIGIWLSDPSGNEIHLDEKGKNLNVTSPETVTIRAKNIVLEAEESITFSAGTHITESAGLNKSTNVGGVLSTYVGGDFNTVVEGKYSEHIKGNLESTTENDRHDNSKDGLNHNTEGSINKNAQKQIKYNSSEDTTQN